MEPDGLLSMGLHRVGHDGSDLAAAAGAGSLQLACNFQVFIWGLVHALETTTLLFPYLCVGILQVLDTKQVLLFTFKKVVLECC